MRFEQIRASKWADASRGMTSCAQRASNFPLRLKRLMWEQAQQALARRAGSGLGTLTDAGGFAGAN